MNIIDIETNEHIQFWIINNRARLMKFWHLLPHDLHPSSIDLSILIYCLHGNSKDQILYLDYTSNLNFLGINLNNEQQYKLFLMFYRLSYGHCPTEAAWEAFKSDPCKIEALKNETIQRCNLLVTHSV
jgi:hypothetical protein